MTMWDARTGICGRYFNSFKINKYKCDHTANCCQKLFVKKHCKNYLLRDIAKREIGSFVVIFCLRATMCTADMFNTIGWGIGIG